MHLRNVLLPEPEEPMIEITFVGAQRNTLEDLMAAKTLVDVIHSEGARNFNSHQTVLTNQSAGRCTKKYIC